MGSCKLGWDVWGDLDEAGDIEPLSSDDSYLPVRNSSPLPVELARQSQQKGPRHQ